MTIDDVPTTLRAMGIADIAAEWELMQEVLAAYADDEDRAIDGTGEPFGSITTECGMKARQHRAAYRRRYDPVEPKPEPSAEVATDLIADLEEALRRLIDNYKTGSYESEGQAVKDAEALLKRIAPRCTAPMNFTPVISGSGDPENASRNSDPD